MESILVTGGVGFIGLNFVSMLSKLFPSAKIRVLDSLTYAANPRSLILLEKWDVSVTVGSITDGEIVENLVSECEMVVNFAAESHNDRSLVSPAAFIDTNLVGTYTLLETVRRHNKRLHHVSTDEVYGDLPIDSGAPFSEDSSLNPSSPYAASKAGADLLVRAWVRSFGVEATISNCTNNYGPYQHIEKFIPRTVTNRLLGKAPRIYGDGSNVRDWIHVEDHSRAILSVLSKGQKGETFLVSADTPYSNLQIAQMVNECFGFPKDDLEFVSDRAGHDVRYAIDSEKIRSQLDWRPTHVDFYKELENLIAWYQENQWWWIEQKESTEAYYALGGK